jgi:hypothetical protein
MHDAKNITAVENARQRNNPASLDLNELERQRQKLAQLIGRLLARHWLRQPTADRAYHDGPPDSPEPAAQSR